MARVNQSLAATTSAVDWDIYLADDFNVPRIDIALGAAPTSAGLITITKDSVAGAAYDTISYTLNPVGRTSVYAVGLHGFTAGDKINVSYANPDGVSITGTASVEIPILTPIHVDDMSFADGTLRSDVSRYRRFFPINLLSSDPGASGATYTDPTANYLGGMRLNAPTDILQSSQLILADWDSSQNPVFQARVTNMVAGVAGDDVMKFSFTLYYAQAGIPGIRTQTFTAEGTVGALPQYTMLEFERIIPLDVVDNPVYPGDNIYATLNLTADSDIDDVLVNSASFFYATTHVGLEDGDV